MQMLSKALRANARHFRGAQQLLCTAREISSPPPTKLVGTSPRPLIVLVHGFLGHRVQFLPLAASLSRLNFEVFNFGYASRNEVLEEHANSLIDAVAHRVESVAVVADAVPGLADGASSQLPAVHYVTHSFGGVVLRAALRTKKLPLVNSRFVLVAPPIRGCIFARTIYEADFGENLQALSPLVRYVAEAVLGTASGQQLMKHSPEWFLSQQEQEQEPSTRNTLVIAGNIGQMLNPLIPEDNDGVVSLGE
jgi:pimeloyl-ACP methyl ester carboxylesterase